MKILACSEPWSFQAGQTVCPGTLHQIDADDIPSGMTIEEAKELSGQAVGLFAVIAVYLLIQRAIR